MPRGEGNALAVPGHRVLANDDERRRLIERFAATERVYSENTARAYRTDLGLFLDFIGKRDYDQVSTGDIRAFMAWMLEQGRSRRTLDRAIAALRSFYDCLIARDQTRFNPARAIHSRPPARRLVKPLTEEEIRRLLTACQSPLETALIETFYATGCRIAEVAGMRIEAIDWKARTTRVIGKGDKERLVPLNRKAVKALHAYLGDRKQGPVFRRGEVRGWVGRSRRGSYWSAEWHEGGRKQRKKLGRCDRMTRKQAVRRFQELVCIPQPAERPYADRHLRRMIKRIGLRAGLRIHPHQLRHSCATHLLDHGADIRVIQELLGHASISTTQIYTAVSPTRMLETMERCHPRWREQKR